MAYDKKPHKINIDLRCCRRSRRSRAHARMRIIDTISVCRLLPRKMNFLLALCLAVLATARTHDDEWEQFKKVSR